MAHVGKFYPVMFRRDFNLNITNNRNGYARAYDGFANDKGGPIGLALNTKPMHCHVVDEHSTTKIVWSQDYQPVAGFNVKFTFSLAITRAAIYAGPSLEIRERSLGILATYSTRVVGTAGYKSLVLQLDAGSVTHPTFYSDNVTQRAGAQAIEWAEYHSIYG